MSFHHLEIPHSWEHYWTKYPEGYTLLEALFKWVHQTNEVIDSVNYWTSLMENFMTQFDKELEETVQETLKEWQESGLLDIVISQALDTRMAIYESANINVELFRLPTDTEDTEVILRAINSVPVNSIIKFDSSRLYTIKSLPTFTKEITLDFNGAQVQAGSSGDIFTIALTDDQRKGQTKFINFNWVKNADGVTIPATIFKIVGGINLVIDGKFSGVKASHSLIWNYQGYGNKFRGVVRWCDCPRVIYLSNDGGTVYSYNFDIDMDITGNTGCGIELEGGNGSIRGVVESCSTGIVYNGKQIITSLLIENGYFENNTDQDILLLDSEGSQSQITLQNSFFHRYGLEKPNCITLGRRNYIVAFSNFFHGGGIFEYEENDSMHCSFLNINNFAAGRSDRTDFETYHSIFADNIYHKLPNNTIKMDNTFKAKEFIVEGSDDLTTSYKKSSIQSPANFSIYPGGSNAVSFSQDSILPNPPNTISLGGQWNSFKDIWANGLIYLPTYVSGTTPARAGAIAWNGSIGKLVYWTGNSWRRMDNDEAI